MLAQEVPDEKFYLPKYQECILSLRLAVRLATVFATDFAFQYAKYTTLQELFSSDLQSMFGRWGFLRLGHITIASEPLQNMFGAGLTPFPETVLVLLLCWNWEQTTHNKNTIS